MNRTQVSVPDVLQDIQTLGLLSPALVQQLRAEWGDRCDTRDCVGQLVSARLLTRFQGKQIRAGRGRRLLLGPYVLLKRRGAGGQGTVYKAEHRLLHRVVALKIIGRLPRPLGKAAPGQESAEDSETVLRFRQEVMAAARLRHPNIIMAHDAGQARGRLYLAMEYVGGVDLQRLVSVNGPLSVTLACEIIRQSAQALHYAHEQGLIHRDIKPANLLLVKPAGRWDNLRTREDVHVKLLDLGLARLMGTPVAGSSAAVDLDLEGRLTGTPDYMAPEWGRGPEQVDGRADLYSLGCTFYYLLTGRVPYPGGTWTEKLLRHNFDQPRAIAEVRPGLPREVEAIVKRLMAQQPEERFRCGADVAEAIEHLFLPIPPPPPLAPPVGPSGPRSAFRALVKAAFVAVLLGVVAGVGARWFASAASEGVPPALLPLEEPFRIEGRGVSFSTLQQAVASAQDGDVLTIHGSGPYRTPALNCRGKQLTIRAAGEACPVLEMTGPPDDPWHALLTADRPLRLERLELTSTTGTPLVSCERAALHLKDCRFLAGGQAVALVARGVPEVTIRGCRIEAGSVGLSVEVAQGRPCRVNVTDTHLTVRDESGVALSLWAPETCQPAPVELQLTGDTVEAGRVLATRYVLAPLTIQAERNRFHFRQALLSFNGCEHRPDWRQTTVWNGQANDCRGPSSWVLVDGQPVAPELLPSWLVSSGTPRERNLP
jgi:serine/threonine protein kinase